MPLLTTNWLFALLLLVESRERHSDFAFCYGHWSYDRTGFKLFAVPPFDDHAAWKLYKMDIVDLQNHKNDINFKYKNRHDTKRRGGMRGCSKRKQHHDSVSVFTCSMAWPTTTDMGWTGCSATQCPLDGIGTQRCGEKHSLALKRTAKQTRHPHVSGPLASQTDRRKTVACYFINTAIIKIGGVLDSVPLKFPFLGW